MPGLIAVVGARRPEELVRRAGQPLLRRPWQRLEVVSPPTEQVALGWVGEQAGLASDEVTGVLAALYGEILVADQLLSGGDGARSLLDLYLREGSTLDIADGWFNGVVWDPRTSALILLSDRLGEPPLYLARSGSAVVAAGELKALVAAGIEPTLDLQTWAEMLAYEHPLGDRTPLDGARVLPSASTLTISSDGDESLRERWRYRLQPESAGEERELLPGFARLLENAVARRLDGSTVLALSGGVDSRSLASIVGRRAPGTLAVTWGVRGSEDFELGALVARRAELSHRSLALEPGWIARGAAETVWLGEGHVRCFHAHHLALRPVRADHAARSLLIGTGGDPIVRRVRVPSADGDERAFAAAMHRARAQCLSDELLEALLTPAFAGELRGRAAASLAAHLAAEEGNRESRGAQYVFRHNHRRKVWPAAALFSDDLFPRDPFDDAALVEFCRRLPTGLRQGGALQMAYLRRFPAIASLPSPKDGLRPRTTGWRRQVAGWNVRVRRGGRRRLDNLLGPTWWPVRRGLADYATDLRRTGTDLLGILLEPRTLARGQLHEEAVRRLVADTLAGRAAATRPLGMLLTFELFQRQFLEGEGPPTTTP
jgi:Asparagine synthase/Glutamine amidotransferase domain